MASRQLINMIKRLSKKGRELASSIIAASFAGITMAILNVLVESIKGNSIFKFKDIFQICFYYFVIWIILGTFVWIIYTFYLLIRKKVTAISLYSMTCIYVYAVIWILIFGYINYHYLPLFLSVQSIIWNLAIFACSIILFIFIVKFMKIKTLKFILKFYVSALLVILISSLLFNINISMKMKSRLLVRENESNNFNVIMLLLDAARYDHFSCYGYKRNTTPNIDRLAARGVIFENAYSASSHTKESIPSIFTSTYPSTHKVQTLSQALPRKILTLPQIFQIYGYKTALFSAAPLVSESYGYDRGVDNYFGPKRYLLGNTILMHLMKKISVTKIPILGFLSKNFIKLIDDLFKAKGAFPSGDPKYVTPKIISWISDNYHKPFFIYAHYMGGHDPYNPPQPYDKLFDPNFPNDPVRNFPKSPGMFLPFVEGKEIPQRNLENMIAQYDGLISYHDKSLGIIFNHLKKLGLDENTIIVITADHGEEFYEHYGWGHGHSLFEETIHVPLIFHVPGITSKLKRINDLVSLVDVFPTLLSLCGISDTFKLPYEIEGIDLSTIILPKDNYVPRKYIFSELYQGGGQSAKCIRTERFKTIYARFGSREERMLFDLSVDPFEKNNLFYKEKEIGNIFLRQIDSIVKESEKKSFDINAIVIDERLKENLRSLGYIK